MTSVGVGVLISGRPLLTTPTTIVSPTQCAFQIPFLPPFQHIAVFLLPEIVLPENTAAAVYAQLPGEQQFRLLGGIANGKPSAVFKIRGSNAEADNMSEGAHVGDGAVVALGISIEPAEQVAAMLEQQKAQSGAGASDAKNGGGQLVLRSGQQNTVTTKVLAQRIIKNCYDFLTSWGSGDTVPLKAFQAWWTKFEGKIERDPGFLERSDGG